MINIIKATAADLDRAISSRIEMLKVVNALSEDTEFDDTFICNTREYLCNSNHTFHRRWDYSWRRSSCYEIMQSCRKRRLVVYHREGKYYDWIRDKQEFISPYCLKIENFQMQPKCNLFLRNSWWRKPAHFL